MATSAISNTSNTVVPTAKDTSSPQAQKDQFLKILLTQLQHQNPTDPMKPEQFASQLAQFSALEQQVDTNTKLDTLISKLTNSGPASISYLGNSVDYVSNVAPVQDGKATWTYATTGAASVKITVKDATGNLVYEGDGDISSGVHELVLTTGDTAADGTPLTVSITALDSAGATVDASIMARAKITAVNTLAGSTGTDDLEANGLVISSSTVTRIATPSKKVVATTDDETNATSNT